MNKRKKNSLIFLIFILIFSSIISIVNINAFYKRAKPLIEGLGEFKSYMDYRSTKDPRADQYKVLRKSGNYADEETGIWMRDGRFFVAMSTMYTKNLGEKIDIYFDNGYKLEAISGDWKANHHVDQYGAHKTDSSLVEFIVKLESVPDTFSKMGGFHVKKEFSGTVHTIVNLDHDVVVNSVDHSLIGKKTSELPDNFSSVATASGSSNNSEDGSNNSSGSRNTIKWDGETIPGIDIGYVDVDNIDDIKAKLNNERTDDEKASIGHWIDNIEMEKLKKDSFQLRDLLSLFILGIMIHWILLNLGFIMSFTLNIHFLLVLMSFGQWQYVINVKEDLDKESMSGIRFKDFIVRSLIYLFIIILLISGFLTKLISLIPFI